MSARLRRRHECDLWHHLLRDVAEIHERPRSKTDFLESRLEFFVIVQLIARFIASAADRIRRKHDHRHDKAFQVLAAQKHLWAYYERVALNRGAQGGRNSGRPMTYGEAYQRLFPMALEELA
jgi:hypothetical protein